MSQEVKCPQCHMVGVHKLDCSYRASPRDPRPEADPAALAKRVAELERIVIDLNPEVNLLALYDMGVEEQLKTEALNRELLEEVKELQSQLAWTPVSAGLPTEPGVYEFYDLPRRFEGSMEVYELHAEPLIWEDEEGEEWRPEEFWSCAATKTHFRRIELPKDGET